MDSRPVSYILSIQMRNSLIEFSTAWSVSLNPKGGTYASTGGSGNVTYTLLNQATLENDWKLFQVGGINLGCIVNMYVL